MNDLPVVRSPWRILILVLGFTFLYAPMLMLVIYSFNSSKLVTVWAGWSTRWYSELFHDDAMMSAVGLSLTIAACAATAAAILGTIAAVVMVRFGRFRGSNGFAFMITAPLVMPDVITGLSLLLLFVFYSLASDTLSCSLKKHHLRKYCYLLIETIFCGRYHQILSTGRNRFLLSGMRE